MPNSIRVVDMEPLDVLARFAGKMQHSFCNTGGLITKTGFWVRSPKKYEL